MAILDTITSYIPFSFNDVSFVITLIVFLIIFALLAAVSTWLIINRLLFSKKIVLFEKVGKTIEPTRKDRARILKWGDSGDTVFFTRKTKKYLPTPTIQTGRNTFWYYMREDGEWINIGIEDIDTKMKEVKAHFLDKEMRYGRVALHRNLEERFKKITFWDKYGGFIAYTVLIVIISISMYLMFDKFIAISNGLSGAMDAADKVIDKLNILLVNMDRICPAASSVS